VIPTRNAPTLLLGAAAAMLVAVSVSDARADTDRTVGSISIRGNQRTHNEVIERELDCAVGDGSEHVDCEAIRARLSNTNLFSEIKVRADSLSEPGQLLLEVVVKERPAVLPYPIVNKSTKSGYSFGGGVVLSNLRGRQERLFVSGTAGGVRGLSVYYHNPWIAGHRTWLSLSSAFDQEDNDFDGFVEETFAVAASVGNSWTGDDRWRSRVGLGFRSLISNEPDRTIDDDNHDLLVHVSTGVTYDTRDIYRNPSRGWFQEVSAAWFGGALGGNVEYAQYVVDLRRYQPVPIGRTLAGFVRATLRTGGVPIYRRLHFGGGSTVRGFPTSRTTGEHGVLAGVEYRFDMLKQRVYDVGRVRNLDFAMSGAFFIDAGAAWTEDAALDWGDVITSAGFGLRCFAHWIDVARFDVAYTEDGDLGIEVGQGMKF